MKFRHVWLGSLLVGMLLIPPVPAQDRCAGGGGKKYRAARSCEKITGVP